MFYYNILFMSIKINYEAPKSTRQKKKICQKKNEQVVECYELESNIKAVHDDEYIQKIVSK